jgi:hypothetical protein
MGIVFDRDMPVPRLSVPLPESAASVLINCPWSPPKVNAEHLSTLARIVETVHQRAVASGTAPVKLHFRFFAPMREEVTPGVLLGAYTLQTEILRSIQGMLFPDTVVVSVESSLSATEYLQAAALGHLALDSFPFGGCNTVMVCRVAASLAA